MAATVYVHETGEAIDDGKIVLVDNTGFGDFSTIKQASEYLQGFKGKQGGIIALKGGQTHQVSTDVDVKGMTLQSGDGGLPIIQAVTGGKLRVAGTRFVNLALDVPAGFGGTYFLDKDASGIIDFLGCDFRPATGKYIIGSSAGGTVNIVLTVRTSGQSLQQGAMIDPAAVFTTTSIYIQSTNDLGKQNYLARPVTCTEDARFDTTGQITGIPAGILTVAPGENIQSRVNSLIALGGGMLKILAGTHVVTQPVRILGSNITIRGQEGRACVIRGATPWTGSGTTYDAVIIVGAENGSAPVESVKILRFTVEALHTAISGICVMGGKNNTVEAMSIISTSTKPSGRCGIIMTDGLSAPAYRHKCINNLVTSDTSGNRWCDGIHIDGNSYAGTYTGIFGFGNGVFDCLMYGNTVEYALETCYNISMGRACSIFVNRARGVCSSANGIPLALLGCIECEVSHNSLINALNNVGGIYIDNCVGCKVLGNEVDGAGSGFVWTFGVGLVAGGLGASTYNHVTHNDFRSCTTAVGIGSTSSLNITGPNTFSNAVTTRLVDNNGNNRWVGVASRGSGSPVGAVNGNFADLYYDTATSTQYICTSYPQGTNWQVI